MADAELGNELQLPESLLAIGHLAGSVNLAGYALNLLFYAVGILIEQLQGPTIGDRTERFRQGEIVLVVPEMPHQWKFDTPSDSTDGMIENITITFPHSLLPELSDKLDEMRAMMLWFSSLEESIVLPQDTNRDMRDIMLRMAEQDDCERLIALLRLLVLIWKSDGKRQFGRFLADRKTVTVNKVIAFLHCNFKREVTIRQLADYVGMNGTSLCALFKNGTGTTIMQYLLGYRILMVKGGLEHSDAPVAQIAYECGFRDVPYFNRTFKRLIGLTPKEYRARCHHHELTI